MEGGEGRRMALASKVCTGMLLALRDTGCAGTAGLAELISCSAFSACGWRGDGEGGGRRVGVSTPIPQPSPPHSHPTAIPIPQPFPSHSHPHPTAIPTP